MYTLYLQTPVYWSLQNLCNTPIKAWSVKRSLYEICVHCGLNVEHNYKKCTMLKTFIYVLQRFMCCKDSANFGYSAAS